MKTLIIEHDKQLLEDITSILKTRWPDCQYFSIEQGIEGIDMVDMTNPDLVILDLDGLDNDGLETIREIRKVSIVPLVVLSRVKDDGSSVAKALYHGADRFIKKPFRALEFLSRINALLRRTNVDKVYRDHPDLEKVLLFSESVKESRQSQEDYHFQEVFSVK